MDRILGIIIGIWIIILGCYLMSGWDLFFRGTKIDFGRANTLTGYIFIIIGVGYIIFFLRAKSSDFEDKFMICIKCKELHRQKDYSDSHCRKCGAELENLEGFYDRHPELKNISRKHNIHND